MERGRLGGSVRVLSSLSSFAPSAALSAGRERGKSEEKGREKDKQPFTLQVNDENINVNNRPAAVPASS